MLRSMYERLNYRVDASDGNAGTLVDYLIDDQTWVIRYAVIDTGTWLPGRRVLMTHVGFGEPDWPTRSIPVLASKSDIKASPSLEKDQPVSRQFEESLYEHYRWAPYWAPGAAMPLSVGDGGPTMAGSIKSDHGDPHLRSFQEMLGYHIKVADEKVGRLENFMCLDETWEIPFLVASIGGWFQRDSLMMPTERVTSINFATREIGVNLDRDHLDVLPEYDPLSPESERLERCVYDYRGRLLHHEPVAAGEQTLER